MQDGHMTGRYRTRDGWSVEVVRLTCTPDHHDGEQPRPGDSYHLAYAMNPLS